MKKKITFLLLMIFATASIYSQNYTISFDASGATNTLDSVRIINLTHPDTAMWHNGDIFQLQLNNAINDIETNKENLLIFPNPMQGKAEIMFNVKQASIASIKIYEITGKEIIHSDENLSQGNHQFQLSGLKQGAYFINIRGNGYFYSSKLISYNSFSNDINLRYNGVIQETITNKYKTSNSSINFNFVSGDMLQFTGYAANLTDVFTYSPTSDITVSFNFITSIPSVTTNAATLITFNSASCEGNVTSDGGEIVTERGICYSTTANPTTANTIVSNGSGTGIFTANLSGLTPGTTYYVRAYATNSVGTAYGNEVNFTTIPLSLPILTTTNVSSITYTTAITGGNISSDGGAFVSVRGVCWSTSPNPTIALSTKTTNGSGTGIFTSNINGLTAGTTYYVRAYATNSAGTAYGNELSFTTIPASLPVLTTTNASLITNTTAITGGNISYDGGAFVSVRGVCWSTSPNPTIALSTKTTNGSGTGIFTSNINGLTPGTTYYVRAYATNSVGTAYGNEVNFTTIPLSLPILTTTNVYSITYTTAITGGNISSDGGAFVSERGVCWSTSPNPTIALSTKTTNGSGTGIFTSNINGLTAGTTYYVRAYATNSAGTAYGNELSFTTIPVSLPVLTTTNASLLTNTTAISGGNISSDGGAPVTVRGVCWSTSPNPTIALSTKTTNGSGTGIFTSNINGLTAGTTYYVRAYATNSFGTAYGNEVNFTTIPLSLPILTTTNVSSITDTSATSGGNISSDGGASVTARGVCWSTSPNPTIADNKTINGTGIGSFTSNIFGLIAGTDYYVRAYATNSIGTAYGNNIIATITASLFPVIDIDGNIYDTVHISTQIWLKQNLKTTHYKNGTAIPNITDSATWGGLSTGARCYYNNDSVTYPNTYGVLYNWYAVNTGILCPIGSHVPTNAEWTALTDYLGGESIAGGKLKEAGLAHWNSPNTAATNETGFTALPGGNRNIDGTYSFIGGWGVFWSANELIGWANFRQFYSGSGGIDSPYNGKAFGFSVRCLMNMSTQANLPVLTTTNISSINVNTATSGGNITSDGGAFVAARGICWSTSINPTIANNKVINGSGNGLFISNLTGLTPNTTYFVRAYATNSAGTAYGNELSFTTVPLSLPVLTTTNISSITDTTATSGGNISTDGGAYVTARGLCWSTSPNPHIGLITKTIDGSNTGSFISNIIGLSPSTTYYVRAYATNSAGTAYGNEISFSTLANLPTLITNQVTSITFTTAISGGNISSDGGAFVTARGVCWSTSPNPNIGLTTKTIDGSNTGSFTSNIIGLTAGTTYYVRAYATNSVGTAYGNLVGFTTTSLPVATFTDYDGNVYDTVQLGTQVWMKQNLKTTHYKNGTAITYPGTNNTAWQNNTTGAYAWYNNDSVAYKNIYGALYNWYAVNTNNLCPSGWHVPSDTEWTTLTTFLGGESIAGGKLKATTLWYSPNTGATNSSRFTALPGGNRYNDGSYLNIGLYGYWWSSIEINTSNAWIRKISNNSSNVARNSGFKSAGFSVRCIKD